MSRDGEDKGDSGMCKRLPYELKEAVVSACGQAFWYKAPIRSFFLSCGVPAALYDRFADESKFKIARHILEELEQRGEEGFLIQRKIATTLALLKKIPDENVPDRDAAASALRNLKELAVEQKLIVKKAEANEAAGRRAAEQRAAEVAVRANALRGLHGRFSGMAAAEDDPQSRGYGLEDLLGDLFRIWEIEYRQPYRTPTEQIDGSFRFEGFDYIVEARWRKEQPAYGDLAAFKGKVDGKLASTRGLFISMPGFRQDVIERLTVGTTSNVLLMDGQDLAIILEDRFTLPDALSAKIKKASQEGVIYFPLARLAG